MLAARWQRHVVLLDVLDVAAHVFKRVYDALVLAGAGEGGQQLEAAALAGHVPLLAGAYVVKQGGVVALHHYAHVAHTCVLQVGESKVNKAVAPRKRQGRGSTYHDQLAQITA